MENKSLACFGLLAFAVINSILGALIGGYVLVKLWIWFAVPVFGLPTITLVPAIGLSILISYLTHQYTPQVKGKEISETIAKSIAETIAYPLIVLFIGWIVSFWM